VAAYTTAKAWPADTRVDRATYWAHHELRGRDYDNRRGRILQRLVRETKAVRVGPKAVRTWKADQRPGVVTPFLEQIEAAVRQTLKRKGSPWDRVAENDRDAISRILRDIAGEVARGEFR
jgi:hypothetical protein